MHDESLKLFKCLADKSRLMIIHSLLREPMYVELLAERLSLSSSTVSFHLKKMEEAGLVKSSKEQYYVVFHINEELLSKPLNALLKVEEEETFMHQEREKEYRKGVINVFFEYGKLKSIPVQQKKRKIVLEEIAKSFEEGKVYAEKEVNLTIADFHDDFCTIRREMVAFRLLDRENSQYWLTKPEDKKGEEKHDV